MTEFDSKTKLLISEIAEKQRRDSLSRKSSVTSKSDSVLGKRVNESPLETILEQKQTIQEKESMEVEAVKPDLVDKKLKSHQMSIENRENQVKTSQPHEEKLENAEVMQEETALNNHEINQNVVSDQISKHQEPSKTGGKKRRRKKKSNKDFRNMLGL